MTDMAITGNFVAMTTERGEAIRHRRMALGIRSVREFATRTGVARATITAAEHGEASVGTYERLEAYLDERERNDGEAPVVVRPVGDPAEKMFEVEVTGNFGVRTIVRGPVSDPEAFAALAERLIRQMSNQQESEDPEG